MVHSLLEDNINTKEEKIFLIDTQPDGREVTMGYVTNSKIVIPLFGKVIRYDQEDAFDFIDTRVSLVDLLDPGNETIKGKPYELIFHSKYYCVIFTRLQRFEMRGNSNDSQIRIDIYSTKLSKKLVTGVYNRIRVEKPL